MNTFCCKRAAQILAITVLHSTATVGFINQSASTASRSFASISPCCPARLSSSFHLRRYNMSSSTASTSRDKQTMSQIKNRVALLQFHVTYDKSQNISTAREYITKARDAGARLCVLPECWNSPYATAAFSEYSENLPNVGDDMTSVKNKWGPSTQMLMETAKSMDVYIVGGSIPEISDGKLYNTCLIIDPSGKVVGKHRKVHLFDIDVPGGIRFIESETLSAGDGPTYFNADVNDAEKGLGRIGVGIWYVYCL